MNQKIHWSFWSCLCKPKKVGGLGFRDLAVFNRVFLAKQCWRLLKFLESLVAKVLKGCYFYNSDFMHAGC